MIVNHQAHWYPPAYFDLVSGRDQDRYPRAERRDGRRYLYEMGDSPGAWRYEIASHFVDLDQQIRAMDDAGIHAAAMSPNMVAELALLDLAEARETASLLNRELSAAQDRYPGRIAGIATLPWQNTDAALEELDRVAELDLRGVLLLSNIGGRPVAEPESWPIFERIDELGLPIFLHPASNSMIHDKGLIPIIDSSAGWMWETSAAAFSLIVSGLLDRYPRLEILHHHLGGVVPYVVGRVSRYEHHFPVKLEQPVEAYLRTRFYVDSMTNTPAAIPLAVHTYGADRILYGDDYPWHTHDEHRAFIDGDFEAELAQKVLHENRMPSLRLEGRR
ncbi:amidohydrolase family protein [Microbacterium sp. A8/3-1]|uniref:Amidohydrolase family protein n=1 Tax=Microbacterium sp. A8/3-1 TaxID=3160749 RepID=A0AAU7W2F5_9MICO